MKKFTKLFASLKNIKRRYKIIAILVIAIGLIFIMRSGEDETTATFAVVEEVSRGEVSSGIQTTGTIVAAQKLDLNVYKQVKRIEAVNVVNGGSVVAGDVILAFDKSSANVGAQSTQVRVVEAELALQQEQENFTDPNIAIRTLQQEIADMRVANQQAEQDKKDAYKTFLNANLVPEPGRRSQLGKNRPVITGFYNGQEAGEYAISVFTSSTESGYSFSLKGTLSGSGGSVVFNRSVDLGNGGLKITFLEDTNALDEWIIAVPNTYAPEYETTKVVYEEALVTLANTVARNNVSIANKEQEIVDLQFAEDAGSRDLAIKKARADLAEAQVSLSEQFEVIQDQNIVAPFSGTIEGMENVVQGATPSRETNDPISLGTLISDQFLAEFSLGAVDVAKIAVGQRVLVTVTSFPNIPPLEAFVTEISSLPESDSTAQYEVLALITLPEDTTGVDLREGLLADIEIVQEQVADVIRVPKTALSFKNGNATVEVIDTVTEEQQQVIDRLGIIRSEAEVFPTYPVDVTVGLSGVFYAEITEGLSEGMVVIVGKQKEEFSVVGSSFGPPRGETSSGSGRPASTR